MGFLGGIVLLITGSALWAYPDPDWPSLPNVGLIFLGFGFIGTVHAVLREHRTRAAMKAARRR